MPQEDCGQEARCIATAAAESRTERLISLLQQLEAQRPDTFKLVIRLMEALIHSK